MAWPDRIALYIVAAFVVVLLLSGIASGFSKRARQLILNRVGSAIYEAITGSSHAEQRAAELRAQTAAALRQALTDLSQEMARGNRGDKQLAQIRTLCPQTRDSCDVLLAAYEDGLNRGRNDFYPMLDAIRDAAAGRLSG